MRREVRFRPRAEADMRQLHDFIASEAGAERAGGYMARIEAACNGLALFPERGRARDDLGPGIRTAAFERRALIVYLVETDAVRIVAVLHAGRQFEAE